MRTFIDRWYGDRCPAWTWPVTLAAIAITGLTAAFMHDKIREQECLAKGGNKSVASGCYSVVETKIY